MILNVGLGERAYDIVIERGCLHKAGTLCTLNRNVLIVTDSGVPAEYAQAVADQCANPLVFTAEQGEGSKSLRVFGEIMQTMVEAQFTRNDCVIAVGGGVVGDLAGFAAASYMRGVDFYNIPTTVLAQVDSSIGGKTAINLGGYKNMVGAFYQPKKVLIDLDTLNTLPRRQIANGLAEAVKMALTSDAQLFELFEQAAQEQDTYAALEPLMETIIERSLRVKKYVVEQDERESGLRKILNFGHTIGHGIEAYEQEVYGAGARCAHAEMRNASAAAKRSEGCEASERNSSTPCPAHYDAREEGLYHGECVALGMIPLCAPAVRARLLPVLAALDLPTTCAFDAHAVTEAIKHDKKSASSGITIITVPEVGTFTIEQSTPEALESLLPLIKAQEGNNAGTGTPSEQDAEGLRSEAAQPSLHPSASYPSNTSTAPKPARAPFQGTGAKRSEGCEASERSFAPAPDSAIPTSTASENSVNATESVERNEGCEASEWSSTDSVAYVHVPGKEGA